jgi:hypothetical protein
LGHRLTRVNVRIQIVIIITLKPDLEVSVNTIHCYSVFKNKKDNSNLYPYNNDQGTTRKFKKKLFIIILSQLLFFFKYFGEGQNDICITVINNNLSLYT